VKSLGSDRDELQNVRLKKLELLRKAGMEPYPNRVETTHTTAQAIAAYEQDEGEVYVKVAGRIRSMREMGKSSFAHIEDFFGRLQLYFKQDNLGHEAYELLANAFDLGDFVLAEGIMFRTRTGEVSLQVQSFEMLAKAIRALPSSKEEIIDGERIVHSAFANLEARYRERYADLAVNPEVREVFGMRARVVDALRSFLNSRGFVEVETPVLQPIYGGAAARPFVTHHNQLHQDLYLRISFELYLKRLLVGGMDRVYEIGRDFRNEGVDRTHNPEFTQLEFYLAYADYETVMSLTEEMVAFAAQETLGTTKITFQEQEIELEPPWKRVKLYRAIEDMAGIDLSSHPTVESLRQAMEAKGLELKPDLPRGKLIETLLENLVEPTLIQPTIVYDYPRDISPFAKDKPGEEGIVERFEGFVAGMEICNAFTEINDPRDQEQRFLESREAFAADAKDLHPLDEDYLRAMSYGMPPSGGFGMGVDRLVMLLTDRPNIREVLLFPHLRSKEAD
jgi:lysyl-tRNA synthetase class 2